MSKRRKKSDHLSEVRQIHPSKPDPDVILEAGRIITNGGIVAFPTKNLYGLGADAFNSDAVERIYKIKRRPYQNPLLVLIKHQSELARLVRAVPPAATCIINCFWPGGITLVFEAKAGLPANLIAKTGRIGVRLPAHPVAVALVNTLKNPITGTSANISGEAGCSDVYGLDAAIKEKIDFVIDAGPLPAGVGSTVVDVTADPVKILREGGVSATDIFSVLGRYS